MLLLQYSVSSGEKKGDLDFENVREVLVIVLMVESPDVFKTFDSDRYIHRFTRMVADTGFSYEMKAKTIYVQLDKCLEQFKAGKNGEAEDGKPDQLQLWLSMIADINDGQVADAAEDDETLASIRKEALRLAQDKEVQSMLTQERYDRMAWVSYGNEREKKGAKNQMEEDAKGMYAEGIAVDVIARIQKTTVDAIEKILGLQPA